MKYSVCIPNYNYAKYIGRTVKSVLDQSHRDLEVLISDNASTDGSVAVIKEISDQRVRVRVNACNVGFAGNLDRAARMGDGARLIMLSSDDLMRADALAVYEQVLGALGSEAERAVLTAKNDIVDPADQVTGEVTKEPVWREGDRSPELERIVGAPVYRVPAPELLRRCLTSMKNPFNFCATCYPRALYEQVEGYGGSRLINPDKWFHWRLLTKASIALYIDLPLFAYRWHSSNQTAQQSATGALKYLVDEYVSTLEMDERALQQVGLDRQSLISAFVEYDIGRHGLATLARGERRRARRILQFGEAVYPQAMRNSRAVLALRTLLVLGVLGEKAAAKAYKVYRPDA
jgi:glycosyltransferase involved in cell wall biosynthesis